MNLPAYSPSLRLARLAAAMTVALPLATVPARAQADEAADTANSQYRQASAAVERKDWPEVRQLLLPLWQRKHTWDVAVGLGKAEWYLGNHAAGARYMAFAAANIPPKEKTRSVEGLRSALAEMKASVGTLQVSVNKDQAEVVADGSVVGTSPMEMDVYLEPGPHILQARLGNAQSPKENLTVEPGKTYTVALLVESLPKASATVPEVPQSDPISQPKPEPSTAHQTEPPSSDDGGSIEPRTIALITGAGVTVVAAGIGVVFALKASSDGNNATNIGRTLGPVECSAASNAATCSDLANSLSSRDKARRAEAVSFGVAAGAAIATTVIYLAWPERQKTKSGQIQLTPLATSQAGGLILSGSF